MSNSSQARRHRSNPTPGRRSSLTSLCSGTVPGNIAGSAEAVDGLFVTRDLDQTELPNLLGPLVDHLSESPSGGDGRARPFLPTLVRARDSSPASNIHPPSQPKAIWVTLPGMGRKVNFYSAWNECVDKSLTQVPLGD